LWQEASLNEREGERVYGEAACERDVSERGHGLGKREALVEESCCSSVVRETTRESRGNVARGEDEGHEEERRWRA